MGKAGQVLRQVLEEYEVSQYSLAMALNIERNSVYRWVNEKSDPSGETILELSGHLKNSNQKPRRLLCIAICWMK
jgi:plasmid maintenance system antidote protein VapI